MPWDGTFEQRTIQTRSHYSKECPVYTVWSLFCPSGTPMALKFFPRPDTSLQAFLREYNLSLSFCTHPSLNRALGIYYSTPSYYVFAQQAGLYGDLYDVIVSKVSIACCLCNIIYCRLKSNLSQSITVYMVLFYYRCCSYSQLHWYFVTHVIGPFLSHIHVHVHNRSYSDTVPPITISLSQFQVMGEEMSSGRCSHSSYSSTCTLSSII